MNIIGSTQGPVRRGTTLLRTLLTAVLALALTACGGGNSEGATKIGFQTSFLYNAWDAPFFLALDKGYYSDEGLDVEIREGQGSGAAIQSLLGGANQIVEAERAAMSIQATEVGNLVSVAGLKTSNGLAIVSNKDRGIKTPADLRGKTIGITLGSSESGILPAFLKQNGISLDEVKIENLAASQKAQFLAAGKVDAISFVDYSAVSIAPLDELNMITFTDYGLTLLGTGLITTTEFAKDHPDAVKAFNRATMKAFNEAIADPDAAIDALLKRTKVLSRDAAMTQWALYVKGAPKPFTGAQDAAEWTAMLASLKDAGVIKAPKPTDQYFTDDFVS
ncbi:ABC transporter substrate-binding protein [Streptosporangium sp. NBC_01810]|uniref:ABC transporter substrate-binding protein n=1 Tax=Streptosporangium sp. NBC_01810 TaxID=2975951 RepID=UPI002DDC2558|nr:ABC transporter substrate-binding protein [Streptosporangium sp. NBC_01810]WSA28241.1 ABC transporter substrate-binding protein [Streptosporangium sp. NBC_01810]